MAEKEQENVHAGHRKRTQEKFRNHGLEGFTDIEALEMLLFYAIPRANTNELSHHLLNHFNGFRGVMEATMGELKQVEGIGEKAAELITFVTAINRRYLGKLKKEGDKLSSIDELCEYAANISRYLREEELRMICLNGEGKLIKTHKLGVGSAVTVALPVREIVSIALRDSAAGVVLTHNHLSVNALPSKADIMSTLHLRELLRELDIELIDHIVVGEGEAVSMRQSGVFNSD